MKFFCLLGIHAYIFSGYKDEYRYIEYICIHCEKKKSYRTSVS